MRLPSDRLIDLFAAEGLIKSSSVKTLHRLAFLFWVCLVGSLLSVPLFAVLLFTGNADGTLLSVLATGLLWLAPAALLLLFIWGLVLYAGYGKKT
jgi:hypothetical protein